MGRTFWSVGTADKSENAPDAPPGSDGLTGRHRFLVVQGPRNPPGRPNQLRGFRVTQVVMQRKSCTIVVFSGSTSTAFSSLVSSSSIRWSTRNPSDPAPTTQM